MLGTTDKDNRLSSETHELIVQLNEKNVSNINLKRKVFKQDVNIKVVRGSINHLERKLSSLPD